MTLNIIHWFYAIHKSMPLKKIPKKGVMYMKKTFLTASLLTASIFLSSNVSADQYIKHEVEWGNTLSEIALNYNTTTQSVALLNSIENIDLIYAGSVLRVDQLEDINDMKEDDYSTENDNIEVTTGESQSIIENVSSKKSGDKNDIIIVQSVLEKFRAYDFKY